MSNEYLEYATVYFWDESGSFSAESERYGGTAHRPYPGRRSSPTKSRRCGGSRLSPSDTPRRHP